MIYEEVKNLFRKHLIDKGLIEQDIVYQFEKIDELDFFIRESITPVTELPLSNEKNVDSMILEYGVYSKVLDDKFKNAVDLLKSIKFYDVYFRSNGIRITQRDSNYNEEQEYKAMKILFYINKEN